MTPVEFEIKKESKTNKRMRSLHRPKCPVPQELVSRLQGHDKSISYRPKIMDASPSVEYPGLIHQCIKPILVASKQNKQNYNKETPNV